MSGLGVDTLRNRCIFFFLMLGRFLLFAILAVSVACKPTRTEQEAKASPASVAVACNNLTKVHAVSDANASLARGRHVLKGVAYGGESTGVDTPGVSSAMLAKRLDDPGYRVDVIAGQFHGDVLPPDTKIKVIGGLRCQQKLLEYALAFNLAMIAGDPAYALHFGTARSTASHGQRDDNLEELNAKRKGWRAYILRPLSDPLHWITSADREIPTIAEAIRSKEFPGAHGRPPIRTMPNVTSTLMLQIGPEGRVSSCDANSIEIEVGKIACALVGKRARFAPMRKADGTARSWNWEFFIDWGNEQRPLKTSGGISPA